jgi:plastocyanin
MATLHSPPKTNVPQQSSGLVLLLGSVTVALAVAAIWWAITANHAPSNIRQFEVSQRGREFTPPSLTVGKGDVVRIVNDDGDLSHHAYIAAPDFNFDSGDQDPGRDVVVRFDVPGTFNVLCGIHPKMRLVVTVK